MLGFGPLASFPLAALPSGGFVFQAAASNTLPGFGLSASAGAVDTAGASNPVKSLTLSASAVEVATVSLSSPLQRVLMSGTALALESITGRTNYFKQSQNAALWPISYSTPASTAGNVAIAPDGTMSASSVTFSNGAQYHYQGITLPRVGMTLRGSLWMRADAPVTVGLRIDNNSDGSNHSFLACALTTGWQIFSPPSLVLVSNVLDFGVDNRPGLGAVGVACTIYVWEGLVEEGGALNPARITTGAAAVTVFPPLGLFSSTSALVNGPRTMSAAPILSSLLNTGSVQATDTASGVFALSRVASTSTVGGAAGVSGTLALSLMQGSSGQVLALASVSASPALSKALSASIVQALATATAPARATPSLTLVSTAQALATASLTSTLKPLTYTSAASALGQASLAASLAGIGASSTVTVAIGASRVGAILGFLASGSVSTSMVATGASALRQLQDTGTLQVAAVASAANTVSRFLFTGATGAVLTVSLSSPLQRVTMTGLSVAALTISRTGPIGPVIGQSWIRRFRRQVIINARLLKAAA